MDMFRRSIWPLSYLGMGDNGRAMDYLEQAYSVRSQWLTWFKMDPISIHCEKRRALSR